MKAILVAAVLLAAPTDDRAPGGTPLTGPQSYTTTDPPSRVITSGHCWPGDDSCSGGDLVLSAGQGATTVTINDYTSCSGATTTFTVCTAAGCSDTTLTEGVDWSAADSDEASAASFASATVAGVSLAAVSDVVRVTLAAGTVAVGLSRNTAACNSVTVGTGGGVRLGYEGRRVLLDNDRDSYLVCDNDDDCSLYSGGARMLRWASGWTFFTSRVRLENVGIRLSLVTSNPCALAAYPEGSIFYNDTGNYWCGCDGTGAVTLSDGTACFP